MNFTGTLLNVSGPFRSTICDALMLAISPYGAAASTDPGTGREHNRPELPDLPQIVLRYTMLAGMC